MFNNFFPDNRGVYEIMWKNILEPDSAHSNIIWCMNFVCWTTKATLTHTHTYTHTDKYVILIALPLQQCFAIAPHCYVIYTLPVVFMIVTINREYFFECRQAIGVFTERQELTFVCMRQTAAFIMLYKYNKSALIKHQFIETYGG